MKYNPRQLHLQHQLPHSDLDLAIITKYDTRLNEWQFTTWKCQHCTNTLKYETNVLKHKNICIKLNSNKKEITND
jgi:hypothetical protein